MFKLDDKKEVIKVISSRYNELPENVKNELLLRLADNEEVSGI